MATSSKNIRHKNADRQMLHEDLLRASEILGIKKTEYLAMCGLGSDFDADLVRGERNPTEYLLRHIARTLRKGGVKRHWRDYLIQDPEPQPDHQITFTEAWGYPQAEQEPAQESAMQVDPHEIEDLLRNHLCHFGRLSILAHELGYRIRPTFELVKEDADV